jgi:AcrR family transcriptional regulator
MVTVTDRHSAPRDRRGGGDPTARRGVRARAAALGKAQRGEAALAAPGTGDNLARAGVPQIQRGRILAALVEVARDRGAAKVTVAHIVARSGVSRRTFYELFDDRDACFLAAFEDAVARAGAQVGPAAGEGTRWREQMRGGLLALLEFLDKEPELGGLCVVDALGAGPSVLARRAQVVAALVDAVDGGRLQARAALCPSRLTAEGVVGAVLGVLYARLAEPGRGSMVGLLNALMGMIVLPYLGPAAAAREAARAAPRARRRAARTPSNPLEGLDMRLTYRTVRVLAAVASAPAASNRQIADAAGVADQGQISKLLARLEHVGLIANRGAGAARGEPNAWRLTQRGREVELAIRREATPAGS